MKMILLLSWRNIWRNKRRSLVVISSIAVGIISMIIAMGIMNGFNGQMVENTINTSIGHIAIRKSGYGDDMKIGKNFAVSSNIIDGITRAKHIKGFTRRVKAQGIVRSSRASRGAMIVGINPVTEKSVSNIFDYMLKDDISQFLTDSSDSSVIISKILAEKLKLGVGSKIIIMVQNSNGELVAEASVIKGLYQSPIESFDRYVIFTGINNLQRITAIGENITEINIILDDKNSAGAVKSALTIAINDTGIEVLSWKNLAPALVSMVKLFDQMSYIFFMIVFITILFSITNTMMMAIMERFHEIGVMKSIGTSPKIIFSLVVLEAVNLGVVGLIAGGFIGIISVYAMSYTGIDMSYFADSVRQWGTGSVIYPVVKTMDFIMAVIIVFLTNISASLYPAFKAAGIKPLKALHYL